MVNYAKMGCIGSQSSRMIFVLAQLWPICEVLLWRDEDNRCGCKMTPTVGMVWDFLTVHRARSLLCLSLFFFDSHKDDLPHRIFHFMCQPREYFGWDRFGKICDFEKIGLI